MTTRRSFLSAALGSTALVGLSSRVPDYLLAASRKEIHEKSDRILVVVQLSGGNDGINTVVPWADDDYYKNRFTLAVGRNSVLKIDDHCGFNPAMTGFSKLVEAGNLSVINGVGYPNPNRSHFDSMDLWHSAHLKTKQAATGWLGRLFDQDVSAGNAGNDPRGIHFGDEEQPLALAALGNPVPTLRSLDEFRLTRSGKPALDRLIKSSISQPRKSDNELLSFVQSNTVSAIQTSERVEQILGKYNSKVSYPQSDLGRKLKTVAQLIGSDLKTNVYYVTLGGFDTHSNQLEAHNSLLRTLSEAVTAFTEDMKSQGNDERVLTFAFSEFGRRLRENASRGTDHGAAAPVFLAGTNVKAGAFNDYPSLTDLQDGDLKHSVDYRQVYATILEKWLSADSEKILGKKFKNLDLFM